MRKYHRLTLPEREEISRQLAAGNSLRNIAASLGRNPSTISREVGQLYFGRNRYRAWVAQKRAVKQRHNQGRKRSLNLHPKLKRVVFLLLRRYFSPQQIASYLKIRYPGDMSMYISHETIYAYLYILPKGPLKQELISFLRRQQKLRKRRSSKQGKNPGIPELIRIDQRPKEAQGRTVPGHWEGDLMLGRWKHSALGTLVERTTRKTLLIPLKSPHAPDVRESFVKAANTLPKVFKKSLTYDRGREMVEHKLFTKATDIQVYFCDPQSPWQRGTNENTIGLVRQFFPKGTDFRKVSRAQIKRAEKLLNSRPRKVLGWQTPDEVFHKLLR